MSQHDLKIFATNEERNADLRIGGMGGDNRHKYSSLEDGEVHDDDDEEDDYSGMYPGTNTNGSRGPPSIVQTGADKSNGV